MTINQGGAVVFALGALLMLVGAALSAYEAFALWTGNIPITVITRGVIGQHHILAFCATAFVLILIGHFWR
jgi:hypothetical protein